MPLAVLVWAGTQVQEATNAARGRAVERSAGHHALVVLQQLGMRFWA